MFLFHRTTSVYLKNPVSRFAYRDRYTIKVDPGTYNEKVMFPRLG